MNIILRFCFASALLPLALTAQAHGIGGPEDEAEAAITENEDTLRKAAEEAARVENPVVIGDDVFHPRSVMVLWATACTADDQRATAYFIVQPSLTDQGRNGEWIDYGDVEVPLQAMWTKAAQEFSSQDFREETVDADEPGKFPAAVREAVSNHEDEFVEDVEQRSGNVTVRIAKYGYYDRPSGECPMPEVAQATTAP